MEPSTCGDSQMAEMDKLESSECTADVKIATLESKRDQQICATAEAECSTATDLGDASIASENVLSEEKFSMESKQVVPSTSVSAFAAMDCTDSECTASDDTRGQETNSESTVTNTENSLDKCMNAVSEGAEKSPKTVSMESEGPIKTNVQECIQDRSETQNFKLDDTHAELDEGISMNSETVADASAQIKNSEEIVEELTAKAEENQTESVESMPGINSGCIVHGTASTTLSLVANYRSEDSDSLDSSSDSDDSDISTSSCEFLKRQSPESGDEEKTGKKIKPRTKGELFPEDLPPLEDLCITVDNKTPLLPFGKVQSIIGILVVIQSHPNTAPMDMDSVVFTEDRKSLGKIFEIFGPVKSPLYSIRFNSVDQINEKGVKVDMNVFCAPSVPDYTHFVFMTDLQKQKGSDASWWDGNEPPAGCEDYSDDEQERMAKGKGRKRTKGKNEQWPPEDSADSSESETSENRKNRGKVQIHRGRRRQGPPTVGHNTGPKESPSPRPQYTHRFGGPPSFQARGPIPQRPVVPAPVPPRMPVVFPPTFMPHYGAVPPQWPPQPSFPPAPPGWPTRPVMPPVGGMWAPGPGYPTFTDPRAGYPRGPPPHPANPNWQNYNR